MKRLLTFAAVLALAAPAGASAKTVNCPGDEYDLIDADAFPVFGDLRAVNLPKKTSGYAPPCLVAETVAQEIQMSYEEPAEFTPEVHPFGASWDGGKYRCKYREKQGESNPYVAVTCTSRKKKSRKITMNMGS
jgi:hypothetical protein